VDGVQTLPTGVGVGVGVPTGVIISEKRLSVPISAGPLSSTLSSTLSILIFENSSQGE
jgi:hypothetical protein